MHETNPFDTQYRMYDAWFDRNANIYQSELLAIRELLPPAGDWVEIGVGSGRFAAELGIPVGIEPAAGIATLARSRGIHVLQGKAESLPLDDQTVDAAFLITALCFVDDVGQTFGEIARVLRRGGHALVALIPKNSRFGDTYAAHASDDVFFRYATLRTTEETFAALATAGLQIMRTVQTLTGSVEDANDKVERPTDGYEQGSFVVVQAVKP